MLIRCPNGHGDQTPAQVSPDYDGTQAATFRSRCLIVRFIFDGQPVDQYFLSPEFVSTEHIQGGDQPLPDEYPEWINKVRAVCSRCFDEATQHATVA